MKPVLVLSVVRNVLISNSCAYEQEGELLSGKSEDGRPIVRLMNRIRMSLLGGRNEDPVRMYLIRPTFMKAVRGQIPV